MTRIEFVQPVLTETELIKIRRFVESSWVPRHGDGVEIDRSTGWTSHVAHVMFMCDGSAYVYLEDERFSIPAEAEMAIGDAAEHGWTRV